MFVFPLAECDLHLFTPFFLTSSGSEERLQGKSQLFFHTQAVPEGMSCQVQPSTGSEIHTHFSVFCSSGKEVYVFPYTPFNIFILCILL